LALRAAAALVLAGTVALSPSASLNGQESPLVSAMQDEMKRSMSELRMKDAPAPYYIAYEVQDRTMTDVSGRLGAVIENAPRRMRVLQLKVHLAGLWRGSGIERRDHARASGR
jgi:hypothetical protein